MIPIVHLFLGLIFGSVIFIISPSVGITGLLLIVISSVLIDIDHYFYYVIKKRNFNLFKAYKWYIEKMRARKTLPKHKKRMYKTDILIFHGIEFVILLTILLPVNKFFSFIFMGVVFHLTLDILDLYKQRKEEYMFIKVSQLYNIIRNRKKEDFDF